MEWQRLVWLALAGAAGTLARFGLGGLMQRLLGSAFPWGTVTINILGSFAFGVIWSLAAERNVLSPELRLIILVGFMGAFTTFSSFMFETGQLLQDGQYLYAAANFVGQNVIGLLCLFLGLALGRAL